MLYCSRRTKVCRVKFGPSEGQLPKICIIPQLWRLLERIYGLGGRGWVILPHLRGPYLSCLPVLPLPIHLCSPVLSPPPPPILITPSWRYLPRTRSRIRAWKLPAGKVLTRHSYSPSSACTALRRSTEPSRGSRGGGGCSTRSS